MHNHAEIYLKVVPINLEEAIDKIMAPFNEEDGDNEQGFWDWYQIGGRYTGSHIEGYDPDSDPSKQETCWVCQGTGIRDDALGVMRRLEDHTYKCNGCQGTGKMTKWPTEWGYLPQDIIQVKDVTDNLTCYTFIFPGDAVFQKKKWDGNTFVETDFNGKVKSLLCEKHITDGYLVTVDYHS
jgi:hypothetical protein